MKLTAKQTDRLVKNLTIAGEHKKLLELFAKEYDLTVNYIDNTNGTKTIKAFFENELFSTISGTTEEKDFNDISQAMLQQLLHQQGY